MLKLGFLLIFGVIACSNADLTTLDQFSLDAFTKVFRQSLLVKVATQWNVTLDESAKLKLGMAACTTKITGQANRCTDCTKRRCSASPSFTDYLQLLNPVNLLKGPLNEIGSTLGDVVDLLGDRGQDFVKSMTGLAGSAFGGAKDGLTDAFHGLKDGLNKVGDVFKGLGSTVIGTGSHLLDGVKDIGSTIGSGISSAGHAIEHVGSSILHSIGSIFGKKREISPQIRHCMEGCSECHAMLRPNKQDMVREVCGDALVQKNATVAKDVQFVGAVYQDIIDKTHPIVQKVEFDHATLNSKMEASTVYLTVYYHGRYVRYRSDVPYQMMNVPASAQAMAAEYWGHSRN